MKHKTSSASFPLFVKVFRDEAMDGEVIVMDDNSPDGTAGIALNLADSYPGQGPGAQKRQGSFESSHRGFRNGAGDICVSWMLTGATRLKRYLTWSGHSRRQVRRHSGEPLRGWGRSPDWPLIRKSSAKGWASCKRVTVLSDPTSDHAVRRSILQGAELDPLGWKIVLEVW